MQHRRRYVVYLLLFLFLSIYSLDRAMMGVIGSTVAHEMGIGPIALGYLFSSYLWLYAVTLLPAGAITDRVGAHRMSAIAAGGWSAFQMLGGFAGSLALLLASRLDSDRPAWTRLGGGLVAAVSPAGTRAMAD